MSVYSSDDGKRHISMVAARNGAGAVRGVARKNKCMFVGKRNSSFFFLSFFRLWFVLLLLVVRRLPLLSLQVCFVLLWFFYFSLLHIHIYPQSVSMVALAQVYEHSRCSVGIRIANWRMMRTPNIFLFRGQCVLCASNADYAQKDFWTVGIFMPGCLPASQYLQYQRQRVQQNEGEAKGNGGCAFSF